MKIAAFVILLILTSCEQANIPSEPVQQIVEIHGVSPASVKPPEVILLDSRPKPQVIPVPGKSGGFYVQEGIKKGTKVELHPPIVKPVVNHYEMKHFTAQSGLPLDTISAGMVDRAGNIWLGSGGGVSKYDGHSFTNFGINEFGGDITSIHEDSSGNIWIGLNGLGLRKYNGTYLTEFSVKEGLPNDTVRAIFQDSYGYMWFGTDNGISRFDGYSFFNKTALDGLAGNRVTSIIQDKRGYLWFGTNGGGVSRYDGHSFTNLTTKDGLASNNVLAIREDKTGSLWFGTDGKGVSRYDGKSFVNYTVKDGLVDDSVQFILEDRRGRLWFGTKGGVSEFDREKFTNLTTKNGLSSNDVLVIIEDKLGNLWFGTYGGGVNRFDGRSFTNFPLIGFVRSIAEDKNGYLWFGTQIGLNKYDQKTFTLFNEVQGLAYEYVRSVFEDSKGNLWIGTQGGGLSKFDGKSFTNFTTEQGLPHNVVRYIYEDANSVLWLGTDGGLSRFDGKSFTNYTTEQGLSSNSIWAILKDRRENLWLGTREGGLSRFDGKSFTNYTKDEGLSNNFIFALFEDKEGSLWIGTNGGGLLRYDGKTFLTYSKMQGLSDDSIYQIALTADGNMAFATNLGLSVLKGFYGNNGIVPVQNSLSNEVLKNLSPIFEIFNVKTGYPVNDGNGGQNSLYLDSRGILWMGTGFDSVGLLRIDFSELHKDLFPPNVQIKKIKINNENVIWYDLKEKIREKESSSFSPGSTEEIIAFGKELTEGQRENLKNKFKGINFNDVTKFNYIPTDLKLPYGLNTITLEFAAIELDFPQVVLYQYMLEGYNKEWSSPENKTEAIFGNLFEGKYRFKVKAKSPFGVWNEPISFDFKIFPPWYRAWWAYLIYASSVVIGLYSIFRWRTEALRRRQEQLERLYLATERFVPKNFFTLLNKKHIEEVRLGDSVEIELTVLFSDIRGFTTISEGLSPKEAFAFVNDYLEVMAPIIRKHHGFINQYHGDGIMALFPGKPDDSVTAVQEMSLALRKYNLHKRNPLKVGYGLNSGPAMLGIIGEKERMEANVISDTINLASRTENLNKFYGTEFLITQGTFGELSEKENFVTRLIDKVRVKGKIEAVYLYEVYFQKEVGEEERSFINRFESAFLLYEKGGFEEALSAFKECLALKPGNQSVIIFIDRCKTLLKEPGPQAWDGIFEMKHK